MQTFEKLLDKLASMADDVAKIEAGNKAARTRVRVGLQEVKKIAQEIRIEINEMQ